MSAASATSRGPVTRRLAVGATENPRERRTLIPPEGVPLPFELANVGDRLLALFVDGMVIATVVIAAALLTEWLADAAVLSVTLLVIFGMTFVYFPWCELRWQGRTLGKKVARLRVIDRAGGRLTARAIVARNLSRDVEMVLPLAVLFFREKLGGNAPQWVGVASFGWVVVLGVVPLLNRDRQRIGDLLAGTVVIHAPRAALLADLSEEAMRSGAHGSAATGEFSFTAPQLGFYGEYELEILADLLRNERSDQEERLAAVCGQVQRKIGWPAARLEVDPRRFLLAFYAAQRAHLEQRLLFGRRKADKRS